LPTLDLAVGAAVSNRSREPAPFLGVEVLEVGSELPRQAPAAGAGLPRLRPGGDAGHPILLEVGDVALSRKEHDETEGETSEEASHDQQEDEALIGSKVGGSRHGKLSGRRHGPMASPVSRGKDGACCWDSAPNYRSVLRWKRNHRARIGRGCGTGCQSCRST